MADCVLDLGPERGDKGGEIVAEGTPEQTANEPWSYTGGYFKPLLGKPKTVHPEQELSRAKTASRGRKTRESEPA